MKIGIDITTLAYQGFGVSNYTYNLVKNLLKIDKDNEYHLFYSSFHKSKNYSFLEEFRKSGATVHEFRMPLSVFQFLWGKFDILPVEWMIGKMDVFYFSDFLRPPLLPGTKGITTIHDLVWKMHPEFHENWIVDTHVRKLEKTIKYHDDIITDSQNTKKDLIKYYPNIEKTNKINVLHPAINENFKVINDEKKIKQILKKYHINYPGKYLLYVGAIEPRKNLETAIEVFYQLITSHQQLVTNFCIVGRAGWKNEKVFQKVKELGLENKVKFIGYVDDNDLPYLYNGARAFIYLSVYEGFGLPPLEAAACGKMSLIYNNSSLSEIFKPDYPYTKKGQELETLKKIINGEYDVKKYLNDFSWKSYCQKFLNLL